MPCPKCDAEIIEKYNEKTAEVSVACTKCNWDEVIGFGRI